MLCALVSTPITDATVYEKYSEPTVVNSTPTYWLRASEVQFLLAEAALNRVGYTNDTG